MEPEVIEVMARLEARDERERAQRSPGSERIQALHPDSGRFVYVLALAKGAKSIVEVGTYELEDYISYVENHPNLESSLVPIGRGLEISVKLAS
ncbi:MAG: hypothetical protein P8186_18030 [Anaerolineae bacterium]